MAEEQAVLLQVSDGIAHITLNRPQALNSFNEQLVRELAAALTQAAADGAVRAVILTGAGRAFCAGGDLNHLAAIEGTLAARQFIAAVGGIVKQIMELDKPVVAMVNGVAAGAGFNLALACDLVFCGESARFAQSFAKVGLVPDCGGLYLLPRVVGRHKAKELMFTADLIDAATAQEMGIVNRVVPDGELREVTEMFVRGLAEAAPLSLAYIKKMVNRSDSLSLDGMLDYEADLQAICMQTADHREGVAAFKEKRKPIFSGK